jgi:flagellar capping protein FliD
MLENQLRSLVSSPALAASGASDKSLADIGISTGAFGSALGTTSHLTLDTAKLTAALTSNPNAVLDALSGLTSTVTKTADPTNPWMASVTGTPYAQVYSGTYQITHDGAGKLTSVFTPTVGAAQAAVTSTITAGGTNAKLINGLVLTANASLPASAGTDTVTFTVTSRGVLQGLNDYLNTTLSKTGLFGTETTSATNDQRSIDVQISAAQARLALKQQNLQTKFTAMEQALAKLQNQSQSLMSQINTNNSQSR